MDGGFYSVLLSLDEITSLEEALSALISDHETFERRMEFEKGLFERIRSKRRELQTREKMSHGIHPPPSTTQ